MTAIYRERKRESGKGDEIVYYVYNSSWGVLTMCRWPGLDEWVYVAKFLGM